MRRRAAFILPVLLAVMLVAGVLPVAAAPLSLSHVKDWGTIGLGPGQFTYPLDLAVDKWGTVYVGGGFSDDHRIQMFSSDGVYLGHVGTTGVGSTLLDTPRAVTTDRWGYVYVGELGNGGRVNVFFKNLYSGVSARSWSGSGGQATNVVYPFSVGVALDGTVYTAENAQYVQRWMPDGTHFTSWMTDGYLTAAAPGPDGEVFAVNDDTSGASAERVMVYSPFGSFLRSWGGNGTAAGKFRSPYDISVDGAGNVFVIEETGARGQAFTPEGTHLATFGSFGTDPGSFLQPMGIAAGMNRDVFVCDTSGNRISKWAVTTPATLVEVAGTNRFKTAAEASKKAFPTAAGSEFAIVATGANWPDALGGAALAGTLKAPLLLTDPGSLSPEVVAEIDRLNVQEIYVLGGEAAVGPAVYNALAGTVGPGDIRRLAGSNRYGTANLIAEEVVARRGADYDGTAFVVTGSDFPDALAVSPIAAANGWPILLTEPTALAATTRATMESIGVSHGYIAGGETAVSAAVKTQLDSEFGSFTRYGAANRYATAALVAGAGFEGMGMLWSRPALATGEDFPDALAGGVLQGSDYSVMLLTPKDSLHPATVAALKANRNRVYELRILGGTAAVATQTRASARALLP